MTRAFVTFGIIGFLSVVLSTAPRIDFVEVTSEVGINFRHHSGATGQKYLPETLGSGALFLDVDSDGWQDILFVDARSWDGEGVASSPCLLYTSPSPRDQRG